MFPRIHGAPLGAAICVVFVLAGAYPAQAQTTWELGLRGGVNAVKLTGDTGVFSFSDVDGSFSGSLDGTRTRYAVGGYAQANMTSRFGARLEALYSCKGGKGDFSGTLNDPDLGPVDFTGEIAMSLDYIELPLLAMMTLPAGSRGSFEMVAGPAVAFKTKSEMKMTLSALGQSASDTTDLEDIKSTDFGGIVGAGFAIPTGSFNVLLDGRWTFGLTSIDDSADSADIKNSAFSFSVGLGFPLVGSGV